jgi:tetratricopeptide (TPR) repeat protein
MNRLAPVALVLFLLSPVNALAAPLADGQAAEKAGRYSEALRFYTAALRKTAEGSVAERTIREKIIQLAQRIQPPPALPEGAEKYLARGEAAVEIAKEEADFRDAAAEFRKALRAAPWLAMGYFNLGVVQEKAGQYAEAIQSFGFYLKAAPSAPDARKVKRRLFGLEYKIERATKRAKMVKKAPAKPSVDIAGVWRWYFSTGTVHRVYKIVVSGSKFQGTCLRTVIPGKYRGPCSANVPRVLGGTIAGNTVRGTWREADINFDGCRIPAKDFPFHGTVSRNGRKIHLSLSYIQPNFTKGNCRRTKSETINAQWTQVRR